MAGVKGAGGPPPKRSDQRRRVNPTAGEARLASASQAESLEAVMPPADDDWHPVARRWYESLAGSGQAVFYQASDWGQAFVMAEAVSRELSPQPVVDKEGNVTMVSLPMKGASLSAFLKGCTDLLVSETARRRAAVELQRPKPDEGDEPAGVTDIRAWKASMNA